MSCFFTCFHGFLGENCGTWEKTAELGVGGWGLCGVSVLMVETKGGSAGGSLPRVGERHKLLRGGHRCTDVTKGTGVV